MASDKFVSRGGEKLQAALNQFQINVSGDVVLDIGSSTGGFVDCLLQNGADKVYAVDTSYGELAWKLRNNSRVVVMERTNALHLQSLPANVIASVAKQSLSEGHQDVAHNDQVKVDLITIDAGWTKLELVLPIVARFLKDQGKIIALLKPHYESPRQYKGGVVPEELVELIKDQTIQNVENLGFKVEKVIDSPILGGAGNKEFLILLTVAVPKKE